ncbi:hypothetical protein ANME2D_01249 [Candidatus Methanoperedens nitroreducens]|uniref:Uncharacterized protein n=1 Tax=Candidatus Methanoperedens nitratireducens TaxID=1392998 RepID=A0A062VAQ5_9EURY|nr:hypothetical protein [Candidatus Methanoperedens nitroreducens]KCZ72814.1 hypothetical protein ANME2D_01249 [Candidatus Methanoperedens nitroreducens]MDJ1423256.1 hypothetical protein [Candidatus Methanoperedens sp.]
MKLLTAVVLILFVVLSFKMVFTVEQIEDRSIESVRQEVFIPVQASVPDIVQTPTPLPTEAPDPEPDYVPAIRPYVINKDHDIWHAQYPSSYITPDNEWVRYYASLLYLDYDGRIRYKNRAVPLEVDTKGNIISWIDEPFVNNYISDNEQFQSLPDADMWVMPDYYLTNGMQDDCDGWMVAVTSLMLSGEMSIKENGQFIKKIIPAKAVLGYMNGYRDGWVEYQVYGKTFLTTTALINAGIDGTEKISSTEFAEKKDKERAAPVFEFTDSSFGEYKQMLSE